MFFGYPIAATTDNWLHECLCEMLTAIHVSIDSGIEAPAWPDIIPVARRTRLINRDGLRERLEAYADVYKTLSVPVRAQVAECLAQQNQIPDLVTCDVDCDRVSDLPVAIQQPITNLFDFAFTLLTKLGVRDHHYKVIFNAISYHVCPFCGCEYFDAPGAPREDLDHYLAKSLYPFAAANLKNLVPMGMRCNERYKYHQDILRSAVGGRRRSFYPYTDRRIGVCLDSSAPFGGADGQTPHWHIEFNPNSPECTTWDEVFLVHERLKRDVLDPSFRRWLREFSNWFKMRIETPNPSDADILNAVKKYSEDMALMGFNAREFLRSPLFTMLHSHCAVGNTRLSAFMRDLVTDAGAVVLRRL